MPGTHTNEKNRSRTARSAPRYFTLNDVGDPMTHASDQKDQQPAAERPTEFTNEIGEITCDRIIDDETLHSICSDRGMPDMATVALWLANNAEFRDRYACVRALQAYGILGETIAVVVEARIG